MAFTLDRSRCCGRIVYRTLLRYTRTVEVTLSKSECSKQLKDMLEYRDESWIRSFSSPVRRYIRETVFALHGISEDAAFLVGSSLCYPSTPSHEG